MLRQNTLYYTTAQFLALVFVRVFWNGGNSLIGLLGALGGRGTWNQEDQMLEVAGGWLVGILSRRRWASAITFGDVVLYEGSTLIPVLHAHERVHVKQYRVWGPLFLPAYLLEAAWQWLRTGDGYRSNRFEVAAYRVNETDK